MSDMRELYQEVILDHNKRPRNFGVPGHATNQAEGHNPLCGDQLTVYLDIQDGRVADVKFMGTGCAISVASASMMTEAVLGKTIKEAEAIFETFHKAMTDDQEVVQIGEEPSELDALSGVKEFPIRVKCATLPWHTFAAALHNQETATTEEDTLDAAAS
jgi:nitrogen fixation NifU-like protein